MLYQVINFLVKTYIGFMLFVITAYVYLKVSVIPINKIYRKKLTIICGGLFIGLIYAILCTPDSAAAQFTIYLFPSMFFVMFEKDKFKIRCVVAFLSYCITRLIAFIPSIAIATIMFFINPHPYKETGLYFIIIYALSFLLTFLLLKIKRFRNGFQFFQDENKMGVGIVVAGIVFVLLGTVSVFISQSNVADAFRIIVIVGLFVSGFGLYVWIRHSITSHYKERLQSKSEEHFKQILSEYETKVDHLEQSNDLLAKVVHRDNHLITSLSSSIDEYFNSGDPQVKDDLLRDIQTLVKERGELIEKEQRESKILPSTGNLLIDGAINGLYVKASAHGIDFSLDVSESVDFITGKFLSQTELQTLLCDHIKDAIIAVDSNGLGKGKIHASLSLENGVYNISIFDSGVDFDLQTLAKLGKERVTTHAESGGSGIGFLTTFDTLKKSGASLIITEFENKNPFSKCVAFKFDGADKFVINSYRAKELKKTLTRRDITVLRT